jgi:hypothetical protein
MRHGRRVAVAAAALVAAGCGGQRLSERQSPQPVDLLPDLVASPPTHVMTGTLYAGGRFHSYLGFNTRVTNRGRGLLDILGRRRPGMRIMVADQVVHRSSGRPRVVRSVAWLRFHRSDHDHWHLLPFADYQLVRADGRPFRIRGRKQGFCIAGIRVGVGRPGGTMPSACGEGRPNATSVRERLSVGSADEYGRFLEGQSISLDRVPPGRYYLVLRLNGSRRLLESNYANDVATALLRIASRGGPKTVRTLRTCRRPPPCSARLRHSS